MAFGKKAFCGVKKSLNDLIFFRKLAGDEMPGTVSQDNGNSLPSKCFGQGHKEDLPGQSIL